MKNKFIGFISLILFVQCNSSEPAGENKSKTEKEQKTVVVSDENEEITCTLLPQNHFGFPFNFTSIGRNNIPTLELKLNDEGLLEGKINLDSTDYTFKTNPISLIPKISGPGLSSDFHQKIAIYHYEKQWHFDSVKIAPEIYIRLINPGSGKNWYAEIFETPKSQARFASYLVSIPNSVYKTLFEKQNPKVNPSISEHAFTAPDLEKIDYNKIRRMGRFYEGFAGATGSMKVGNSEEEKKYLIRKLNSVNTYQDYFEKDFKTSKADENGFDTTETELQSLNEFYNINGFIYKTSYSLGSISKDSLLEIQFDFKNKNGNPTQRFVIGGIPFSKIDKLLITDYHLARFVPVGFSPYADMPDGFCIISNMSGYWSDNSYGRNVGGLKLYWDKFSRSKMHIWLIAEDGFTPLMHYVSNLDRLFEK